MGVVAALISTLLSTLITDINLFNGATIAVLIYIVTYYILKLMFAAKVEKPTKILTMGIFAYFLTWLVTWTIFYTVFINPLRQI